MIVYQSGVLSAVNIRKKWNEMLLSWGGGKESIMKVCLVNPTSRPYVLNQVKLQDCNILESYWYIRSNEKYMEILKRCGSFMLDSGAFTFLKQNDTETIDWERYITEYAQFINKHDIKLFFELDIDKIVGIKEVERLRDKLESLTGKKCIPVWHINRGKEYFIKMCKEYKYIALGGIAIKEIPTKVYEKYFPWFINTAHQYGTKIHGLGYTSIEGLKKYKFDSVDSTRWLHGNIGGYIYKFNPTTKNIETIKNDKRLKAKEGAINNFIEWVKFTKYLELRY